MSRSLVGIIIFCFVSFTESADFHTKLVNAEKTVDNQLKEIFDKWQVDRYPNFLKSCSMSKFSWEFLKQKFRQRILDSELHSKPTKFTICFMGSSVTAGHDSPFNKSFSVLMGPIMQKSLRELNVHAEIRSVALGNNPLYPYDICVRTFCGEDSDIIHWEQSYFGGFGPDHGPTLEQFIRQSTLLASHPIVIFADSATPNWLVLNNIF